jgi:uncharacterized membrane protein YkoI
MRASTYWIEVAFIVSSARNLLMMNIQAVVLITAIAVFTSCTKTTVQEASEQFNELPAPVQETVRSQLPDAEVASIEKHTRDNRIIYEIHFRDSERNPSLEVTEDGTIVKYEAGRLAPTGRPDETQTMDQRTENHSNLSALPIEVQQAIQKNAPPAEVENIRRVEQDGQVVYEIDYAGKDESQRLRVGIDGTILPREANRPSRR